MSKILIGDLKAYHGPNDYTLIGAVFEEVHDGEKRISVKIDALPLPTKPWTGWCNVFARKPRREYADEAIRLAEEARKCSSPSR